MKGLPLAMMTLVVVGTVNWGLIGLGHFLGKDLDVVNMLLGGMPALENIVYILVGLSGVMLGHAHFTGKCKPR